MDQSNDLALIIVDASAQDAEGVAETLRAAGHRVETTYVADREGLESALRDGAWNLIIARQDAGDLRLADTLAVVAAGKHDLPVIGLAGEADNRAVVEALRAGARDLVLKQHPDHMRLVIARELARAKPQPSPAKKPAPPEPKKPAPKPAPATAMPSISAEDISNAVKEGRLSLVFQPIVSLHGGPEHTYEAFLRMLMPDGAAVPTRELFAAAARAKVATKLDTWVVQRAIGLVSHYQERGENLHMFIKLSDQAIRDESVLLELTKLLKTTKVDHERLNFELSVRIAASEPKLARAYVTALKRLKCATALEHFGTDPASTAALEQLDVKHLKIDATLIDQLSSDPEKQQAVAQIQETAKGLEKSTIATSVQDATSLAILWQCGVNYAQGNYIHEPSSELNYDFSQSAG